LLVCQAFGIRDLQLFAEYAHFRIVSRVFDKKTAFVSEGRSAFSSICFYGLGGIGVLALAFTLPPPESTMIRALLQSSANFASVAANCGTRHPRRAHCHFQERPNLAPPHGQPPPSAEDGSAKGQ
jgi:hypothetical protein